MKNRIEYVGGGRIVEGRVGDRFVPVHRSFYVGTDVYRASGDVKDIVEKISRYPKEIREALLYILRLAVKIYETIIGRERSSIDAYSK